MFGLLIREGIDRGPLKNIGDYVQSIAQRQFLPSETTYIDIERLSEYNFDEQVNLVMNGWFTWNCSKFCPQNCINPLFISFHLSPPKEIEFFTPETTAYLKKHEPIGARDMKTMEIMQSHGIDSYFSGCLTLTLGNTYHSDKHDGQILIVDPYVEFGGDKSKSKIRRIFNSILFSIKNFRKMLKLKNKFIDQYHSPLSRISKSLDHFMQVATFYEIYSKRFSDEILFGATYMSALVYNYMSNDEKIDLADKMLKEYSKAKLVITSRLHVSFPCLAMGTKNIFVIPSEKTEEKDVVRYSGRLKGLEDTVTVLEMRDYDLYNKTLQLPKKINLENMPDNMEGYKKYRDFLTSKVTEFIKQNT